MDLNEITQNLEKVSDIYSERFQIKRDTDWYVLKIQEELGELVSAHLKLTERGRIKENDLSNVKNNLEDEIADVLAMTLLFARHKGIDAEAALKNKWFKYLLSEN